MPRHTHSHTYLTKGVARAISLSLSIFDGSDSALGYVLCCFYLPPYPNLQRCHHQPGQEAGSSGLPHLLPAQIFSSVFSGTLHFHSMRLAVPIVPPDSSRGTDRRCRIGIGIKRAPKVVVNCQNAKLLPLVAASGAHVAQEAKARRATTNDTQLAG